LGVAFQSRLVAAQSFSSQARRNALLPHCQAAQTAVVSDEPTTLQIFAEYGWRFDIGESFLDDQFSGWNLQKSEIRSVCDLSRLWFILAIATLYVAAQGVEMVDSGCRRWVDTHWFRSNRQTHAFFLASN